MTKHYEHLGIYSDWVDAARNHKILFPTANPGKQTLDALLQLMGFNNTPEFPQEVRVERKWEADGITGEVLSWSVGYGPRTEAYLMKPADAEGKLPAVVALHDHGGFKWFGKEKIANGPDGIADPVMEPFFREYYGSRPWVNALVKEGFVVLVHDTFLWGSRKFPWEIVSGQTAVENPKSDCTIEEYNQAAANHEHVVEKYCNLLGTTMAGVVSHEDRIALNYLLSREEVDTDRVACMGLSGGGNRSCLLTATHDGLAAAVVVGLMSTYEGLLDHNVSTHTWMLFPSGWSQHGDWPDIAACRAPRPLLVQYDNEDTLFTPEGMHAAHDKLQMLYTSVHAAENYTGQFYPGPHKFDEEMQAAAFDWLKEVLNKEKS
ncbi:MAG: hypothetical protein V2J07_06905 [Anaerolineae bacterium]|jgi:dienelactone hydrolase|nr:hypothetical protein [Anaerolineae bacterium]